MARYNGSSGTVLSACVGWTVNPATPTLLGARHSGGEQTVPHRMGQAILAVSGMGFPLTQLVIRRFGRRGAFVVEAVSVGFLARDVAMIAAGTPHRLHRGPAILLWLEGGVAAAATLIGLRLLVNEQARQAAVAARPAGLETLRRVAVGALFGLHTLRFRIYLQPDQGRRQPADS